MLPQGFLVKLRRRHCSMLTSPSQRPTKPKCKASVGGRDQPRRASQHRARHQPQCPQADMECSDSWRGCKHCIFRLPAIPRSPCTTFWTHPGKAYALWIRSLHTYCGMLNEHAARVICVHYRCATFDTLGRRHSVAQAGARR